MTKVDRVALPPGDTRLADDPPPGQDLRLSYHSDIDDTEQPYALYVPSGYDPGLEWPLIVNLHGTSAGMSTDYVGQTSEHYTADENAQFLWAAEKHDALLLTPFGRGVTEFRGIGENDVFRALEEVQQRYNVDPDRVSLTGLSMGGTGSFEIGLHHPGVFSAVAPVGSAYSFPWLASNGQHTPFWCVGGEHDRDYVKNGGKKAAEKMIELGYPTRLDVLKTREHADFLPDFFDQVVEWLVEYRVERHPNQYTFTADMPMFGEAYWTAIDAFAQPERVATVRVRLVDAARISLQTVNVEEAAVLPDTELVDLSRSLAVEVDGTTVFDGRVTQDDEIRVTSSGGFWRAEVAPRRRTSLTEFHANPVAEAPEELKMNGVEAPLANWIADAMRSATGADLAMYNRRYYRGLPIPKSTVDEVDLLHCSRPSDQYLAIAELTGRDIVDILEDNLFVPETLRHSFPLNIEDEQVEFLVQPSGFKYSFDRNRPVGQRIVDSDLDAETSYRVALQGQVPERAEVWRRATIRLADKYPLRYQVTDIPFRTALYAQAVRTGRIEATIEGRVRMV